MIKRFNISYKIPELFTGGNYISKIEHESYEEPITKLLTESIKMLVAIEYKCEKKDIEITDIKITDL